MLTGPLLSVSFALPETPKTSRGWEHPESLFRVYVLIHHDRFETCPCRGCIQGSSPMDRPRMDHRMFRGTTMARQQTHHDGSLSHRSPLCWFSPEHRGRGRAVGSTQALRGLKSRGQCGPHPAALRCSSKPRSRRLAGSRQRFRHRIALRVCRGGGPHSWGTRLVLATVSGEAWDWVGVPWGGLAEEMDG